MNKKDQILAIITQFAKGNKTQFANIMGVSNQAVSSWIARESFSPELFYQKLPGLSAKWLLSGEGPMLETGERSQQIADVPTAVTHFVGSPDPDVAPEGAKLVLFYDVDFMGGFGELENDQTVRPDDWVVSPGFERATLWCRCVGRSMEPMICNGDLIALRHCRLEDVQYGSVYAVVLDTIRTIKVLRRSATPDRTLLFVPVNRQEYDEQEFPLDRIRQVFEVLGCTHYLGQ